MCDHHLVLYDELCRYAVIKQVKVKLSDGKIKDVCNYTLGFKPVSITPTVKAVGSSLPSFIKEVIPDEVINTFSGVVSLYTKRVLILS